MTTAAPGQHTGQASHGEAAGSPATLVLSRVVLPGHQQAFEEILHRLAAEARTFPGHQGLTVLRPQPGGPLTYTIVAHFATGPDLDAWLSSDARARLVAEANAHAAGGLATRHLSGLEGWLVPPGAPVIVPPARWRIVVISLAGIVPLLEAVNYLFAPHLAGLPSWARPLISAAVIIPLMQYAVMPVLTRAARGFLYPAPGGARRPARPLLWLGRPRSWAVGHPGQAPADSAQNWQIRTLACRRGSHDKIRSDSALGRELEARRPAKLLTLRVVVADNDQWLGQSAAYRLRGGAVDAVPANCATVVRRAASPGFGCVRGTADGRT